MLFTCLSPSQGFVHPSVSCFGRELSQKTAPNCCTESHLRINLTYLKGFNLLLFVSTKNRPSCVFAWQSPCHISFSIVFLLCFQACQGFTMSPHPRQYRSGGLPALSARSKACPHPLLHGKRTDWRSPRRQGQRVEPTALLLLLMMLLSFDIFWCETLLRFTANLSWISTIEKTTESFDLASTARGSCRLLTQHTAMTITLSVWREVN